MCVWRRSPHRYVPLPHPVSSANTPLAPQLVSLWATDHRHIAITISAGCSLCSLHFNAFILFLL